ncbi:glycosyltransferase [Microbacterium sp. ProA8]|uniref:glycosyltransferase n=1 Tax=Microbacterium chionoecetis TaxID=3153754 RepID=UPI003263B255
MTPVGAICMAVYRPDAVALKRQIDSLQAQSIGDWRCEIAIDGGRPSDLATVHSCVGGDGRFRVVNYVDRVGFYRNFERAMKQVDYEVHWIALADQDDRWYPDKLEKLIPLLDGAELVTGQARVVIQQGTEMVDGGATRRRWLGLFADLLDNSVTGSFCVFTPSVARAALPFPQPTDAAYHDHWIGACAAAVGSVRIIDDPLQDYIQHDRNVVGESRGGRWLSRLADWRTRAGGSFSLSYLAAERWGWRVEVARTLLERVDVDPNVQADLELFASGRLSTRLVSRSLGALWKRQAPVGRVVALLVGAGSASGLGGGRNQVSARRAENG